MNTTEQTTDPTILGVTIPADLTARASQSHAEIAAILTDATVILERARAVLVEADQLEESIYLAAKALTDGREALDGASDFVSALTGSRALNAVMAELSALADPDEALRESWSERVS